MKRVLAVVFTFFLILSSFQGTFSVYAEEVQEQEQVSEQEQVPEQETYEASDVQDEHFHSWDCYYTVKVRNCSDSNHEHTFLCYETVHIYICGMVENPNGTADIQEQQSLGLYCGMIEHLHTPDCVEKVGDEYVLVCGMKEHTHSDSCYEEREEAVTPAETELIEIAPDEEEVLLSNEYLQPSTLALIYDDESLYTNSLEEENLNPEVLDTLVPEIIPAEQMYAQEEQDMRGNSADPVFPEPITADGITLERVTMRWLSASTGSDEPAKFDDLYLAPSNETIPNQQWQVDLNLSGKGNIEAGAIEIVLPAYLWLDRYGREPGLLTLAVPREGESQTADFAWKRVGNNIVITNVNALSAASKYMLQGTFRMTSPDPNADPVNFQSAYSYEMTDGTVSDDFYAVVSVQTPRTGDVLTMPSNTIKAVIDTYSEATGATKKAVDSVWLNMPSKLPQALRPQNPENYYYVQWYVDGRSSGSQLFTMSVTDTVNESVTKKTADGSSETVTVDALMLGASVNGAAVPSADGKTVTANLLENGWNDKDNTAYIWTAYPKDQFEEEGATYTLHNSQTIKVVGTDDNEDSEKTASASVSFKKPIEWKIKKVWNDNNNAAGRRPSGVSVWIQNTTTNKRVASGYLNKSNNWSFSWADDGSISEYQAYESSLPGGSEPTEYFSDGSSRTKRWSYTQQSRVYDPATHTWTFTNKYNESYYYSSDPKLSFTKSGLNHTNYQQKATSDRDLQHLLNGRYSSLISHSLSTNALILPYTVEEGANVNDTSKHGKREVTLELKDEQISFAGRRLSAGEYAFRSVTLRSIETYGWIPDEEGARPGSYEDSGTWNPTGAIPVEIWGKPEGSNDWVKYAVFDSSGVPTALEEGVTVSGRNVLFSDELNIYAVKAAIPSRDAKVSANIEASYVIRPSDQVVARVESAFSQTDTAMLNSVNYASCTVYDSEGGQLNSAADNTTAYLHGRNYKLAVDLSKKTLFTYNDRGNRNLVYTNTLTLYQQSNVPTLSDYESSIEDGQLPFSAEGVFYDLLPPGMFADESSFTITDGTIKTIDVYENYNGSGRQLVKVKAVLNENRIFKSASDTDADPGSYHYRDSSWPDTGYGRKHVLTFKSTYSYDEARNRGLKNLRNTAAYEADEPVFGNMRYWTGENDAPSGANHKASLQAVIPSLRQYMTNLDPDRNDPVFVYAGDDYRTTETDYSALSSIRKHVQAMGDEEWSDGLRSDVNVYEGGKYTYRLTATSFTDTVTKDIIILDSFETHKTVTITDPGDTSLRQGAILDQEEADAANALLSPGSALATYVETPSWKGTFRSVDVSEIEAMGCKPVIYYSTVADIDLSPEIYNPDNEQNVVREKLQDTSVWSTTLPDDPSTVTAIAIDCGKKANDSDFELTEGKALIAYIHMQAPTYETQPDAFADTDYDQPKNNAHAFNSVYMDATSFEDLETPVISHAYNSSGYTMTGIIGTDIDIVKNWDDLDDNDGFRPESVHVELLRNGESVGKETDIYAEADWQGSFEHVILYDDDGIKYDYSIRETEVSGYTSTSRIQGTTIYITNKHIPETINVPFSKEWTSNEDPGWEANIPDSVNVRLFRDDVYTGLNRTIRAGLDGSWKGSFNGVLKYHDHGTPYVYTVDETVVPTDFYRTVDDDTNTITNIYYPYGDLSIEKEVRNATDKALDNSFSFTLSLKDDNGEPYVKKYAFRIVKAEDETQIISEGEAGNGDTFQIFSDEKILIYDIPSGANYTVTESPIPGFTNTAQSGTSGKIRADRVSQAVFTNTYSSRGTMSLQADKELTGSQELRRYFFRAEVYDDSGKAIKVSTNQMPYESDPEALLHRAKFNFGQFNYTDADDAQLFVYTVKETDQQKAGYTYDTTEYTVLAAPRDNGNGTMTIERWILKSTQNPAVPYDASGTWYLDEDPAPPAQEGWEVVTGIEFSNRYEASGETTLRAWKVLEARDLTDGEFTFELLDEEGNVIDTAVNTADGSVVFNALKFTEQDAGKTYKYAIREKKGTDATVNYDESVYGYSVYVVDYGNGTLGFTQSPKNVNIVPEEKTYSIRYAKKDLPYGFVKDIDANDLDGFSFGFTGDSPDDPGLITAEEIYLDTPIELKKLFSNAYFPPAVYYDSETDEYIYNGEAYTLIEDTAVETLADYVKVVAQIEEALVLSNGNRLRNNEYGTGGVVYFFENYGWTRLMRVAEDGDWHNYIIGNDQQFLSLAGCPDNISFLPVNHRLYSTYPMKVKHTEYRYEISDDEGELPVFRNTLKPGSLNLSKYTEDDPGDGQEFKFKIKLIGPDVDGLELEYELEQAHTPRYQEVTFDANGGHFGTDESWTENSVSYTWNGQTEKYENDDPDVPDPVRNGYSFGGWTVEPDGEIYTPETEITGNKTVYAKWDALPLARYAVSLYGIGIDMVAENDNLVNTSMTASSDMVAAQQGGLTFGPAYGENYTNAFKAHTPSGLTESGNEHRCLHEDDWSVIIEWNNYDPYVYEQCISEGCTHSVYLDIPELLKGTCTDDEYAALTGDGVSVLLTELAEDARRRNPLSYSGNPNYGTNYGGWGASRTRAMLNGYDSLTLRSSVSGYCTEAENVSPDVESYINEDTLIKAFPVELQNAIGKRKTLYDSVWDSMTYSNLKRSYDKLWLLSVNEIWPMSSFDSYWYEPKYSHPQEGSPYPYFTAKMNAGYINKVQQASPGVVGYGISGNSERYWFRSIYRAGSGNGENTYYDGSIMCYYSFFDIGICPCFTLKRNSNSDNNADSSSDAGYENRSSFSIDPFDADSTRSSLRQTGTPIDIVNGEFEITLKGGEAANIDGIPAGTAYQIYEETPDGWVLVETVNASGTINALETVYAAFTNKYQPGTTTAQFTGVKLLDNQPAEAGAFEIELVENGSVIQTKTTLDGGFIQFDPIVYDSPGVHTYTVREVTGASDTIDYDTHTELITVTVTDDGEGNLTAVTSESAMTFSNTTRPGVLKIKKEGEGVTEANKDDLFTFKVTLYNENGTLVEGGDYYYYREDEDGKVIPESRSRAQSKEEYSEQEKESERAASAYAKDASFDSAEASTPTLRTASVVYSGTHGTCRWEIDSDGVLTVHEGTLEQFNYGNSSKNGWLANDSYKNAIKKVVITEHVIAPQNGGTFFAGLSNLEEVDLSGLDTSQCTDFETMFRLCPSLKSVDLSCLDTSNVTNYWCMFDGCTSMTSCNISGFNTSNIVSMDRMFKNCSSLESIDLSSFSSESLQDVECMFYGCSSLRELDLSWMNTSNITLNLWYNFSAPFCGIVEGCTSLRKITLGPLPNIFSINRLRFYYHTYVNLDNYKYLITLPTPPNDGYYKGKWIREDEVYGPYTSAELREGFTSDMAGTWVWEMDESVSNTYFDANGGFTTAGDVTTTDGTLPDITMPDSTTTTRPGYILIGWSTDKNGESDIYEPGETVTGITRLHVPLTLYAQWLDEGSFLKYKVEHYQQNSNLSGYNLTDSSTEMIPYEGRDIEVTPPVNDYPGFVTPEPQTVTLSLGDITVIKYYYDCMTYKIEFDGNGATSGQMTEQTMVWGISNEIKANVYSKSGEIFTGWNTDADGNGTKYTDKQRIALTPQTDGETITLYAQWSGNGVTPVKPTQGEIYVTAKAGETIVFPDLPAGTKYTIEEVGLPAGWTQDGDIEGAEGTILANGISKAKAKNRYEGVGSAAVTVYKDLVGGTPQVGQFSFKLFELTGENLETVSELETAENGAPDQNEKIPGQGEDEYIDNPWYLKAPVRFSDISFTEPGTYHYQVVEIGGSDPQIIYDTEAVKNVTIEVEDAGGGILEAAVIYEGEDRLFTNRMSTGDLRLTKELVNATEKAKDAVFNFTVRLYDGEGNELTGEYQVLKRNENQPFIEETEYETVVTAPTSFERTRKATGDTAATPRSGVSAITDKLGDGDKSNAYQHNFNRTGTTNSGYSVAEWTRTQSTADPATDMTGYVDHSLQTTPPASTYSEGKLRLAYVVNGNKENVPVYIRIPLSPGVTIDESESIGFFNRDAIVAPDVSTGMYLRNPPWSDSSKVMPNAVYDIVTDEETGQQTLYVGLNYSGSGNPKSSSNSYMTVVVIPALMNSVTTSEYSEVYSEDGWYSLAENAEAKFINYNNYVSEGKTFNSTDPAEEYASFEGNGNILSIPSSKLARPGEIIVHTTRTENFDQDLGTIKSGDTVSLKGGENIRITGLPHNARYVLEEAVAPGFELTDSTGLEGVIVAGEEAFATAENTYSTSGSASISVTKVLLGRELTGGTYLFELTDENGVVLAEAYAGADGNVSFALDYSAEDDGQDYTYYVREVQGTEHADYDIHDVEVDVHVEDNGSGEMTATVNYPEPGARTFTNLAWDMLEIHKTIDGSMGNKEDVFDFTFDVVSGRIIELPDGWKDEGVVEGKQRYSFKLGHDGTTAVELLYGTEYIITESNGHYNTTMQRDAEAVVRSNVFTGSAEKDSRIEVKNTLEGAIPTEVFMPTGLLVILIAAAGIAVKITMSYLSKRRS